MTRRPSRRTEFIRPARAPCAFCNQNGGPAETGPADEGLVIHTSLQVGKYLISPLTRRDGDGRYRAAVSIRSGRGSMTHDRVMRFASLFDSHDQAARFATERAMAWIGAPAPQPSFPTQFPE